MAHVVRLNLRDNRRVLVAVRNVQPPQAFERISCFAGVKKVFNPDWTAQICSGLKAKIPRNVISRTLYRIPSSTSKVSETDAGRRFASRIFTVGSKTFARK